jgi:hypothetical protein
LDTLRVSPGSVSYLNFLRTSHEPEFPTCLQYQMT